MPSSLSDGVDGAGASHHRDTDGSAGHAVCRGAACCFRVSTPPHACCQGRPQVRWGFSGQADEHAVQGGELRHQVWWTLWTLLKFFHVYLDCIALGLPSVNDRQPLLKQPEALDDMPFCKLLLLACFLVQLSTVAAPPFTEQFACMLFMRPYDVYPLRQELSLLAAIGSIRLSLCEGTGTLATRQSIPCTLQIEKANWTPVIVLKGEKYMGSPYVLCKAMTTAVQTRNAWYWYASFRLWLFTIPSIHMQRVQSPSIPSLSWQNPPCIQICRSPKA